MGGAVAVTVAFAPDSPRARAVAPFTFVADIFLALLKMLIVPLVLTSIITGVAMEDDLRAEVDLLRAELDMLKRAFRRHCLETME